MTFPVRVVFAVLLGFGVAAGSVGAYAQSANSGFCGDATGGTVTPEERGYCDIYQRQISFRSKTKAFRDSLDKRRVAYEEEHFKAIEKYRSDLEKIYQDERDAYQDEVNNVDADADVEIDVAAQQEAAAKNAAAVAGEPQGDEAVSTDDADSEGAEGEAEEGDQQVLKEKLVPSDPDAADGVPTKIIMPEDAPPF
ncbi:MAG: hypothetical protein KDI13_07905 [Alphaproteobacteria bacterium]|nr:hypothetical protein [Alphaproteobacteria bacterium]